jgi:hypothetical protein
MSYIYRIENILTKEFYIGSRLMDVIPEEDLWVKYFTSSKYVRERIKEYGKESFTSKVIAIYSDKDECFIEEQKLIKENIKHPLCLNKQYKIGGKTLFTIKDIQQKQRKRYLKYK